VRTRVCAFLFALAVSAAPALGAVATAKYTLTNSGWTDLGAGPLLLAFRGTGVFAIGDTTPTLVGEGFGVRPGRSKPLKTTSHVWATAKGAFGVDAYVAPITGGGPAGCSQATTYLARTVGGTEGGNAANITALICGLVSDGVIDGDFSPIAASKPGVKSLAGCGSHLNILYVFAQQNRADALFNICSTGNTIGDVLATTFTSYKGFGPFSGVRMTTGFFPGTSSGSLYLQNNASLGVWAYNAVPEAVAQFGTYVATTSHIFDANTDGKAYVSVNSPVEVGWTNPGTKGLYVGERSDAANVHLYWDGVDQGALSSTSNVPDTSSDFVLGQSYGISAQILSEAHAGGLLGATLNLALYNRLRTYMTAVGVP
jgi:hypothetical protein